MVTQATNRTLYTFKPDDSINAIPDLAEGKPEISADNKTITVKIKRGVKYAPPVDREVKAADIKYAFERAFSKNVPSGYAGAYFSSIVGAPEAGAGSIKDISGITTPDDYTIAFKLSEAQAPLVARRSSCRSPRRCPRSTPRSSTPRPVDLRAVRGLHRPVHDQERLQRQAHRPSARQADRHGPQPELGSSRPTSARRTSTRSASRRATTTSPSPRVASSAGRTRCAATRARHPRRSSSARCSATRTRSCSCPAAARATSR